MTLNTVGELQINGNNTDIVEFDSTDLECENTQAPIISLFGGSVEGVSTPAMELALVA